MTKAKIIEYALYSGAGIAAAVGVLQAIKAGKINAADEERIKEILKMDKIDAEKYIDALPQERFQRPTKYIYDLDKLRSIGREGGLKGFGEKILMTAGEEAVKGKGAMAVHFDKGDIDVIVGPKMINKNVLLHEIGHRRPDAPTDMPGRMQGLIEEEEAAWEEAYKHTKPKPEDKELLNTYYKARQVDKVKASALLAMAMLIGSQIARGANDQWI